MGQCAGRVLCLALDGSNLGTLRTRALARQLTQFAGSPSHSGFARAYSRRWDVHRRAPRGARSHGRRRFNSRPRGHACQRAPGAVVRRPGARVDVHRGFGDAPGHFGCPRGSGREGRERHPRRRPAARWLATEDGRRRFASTRCPRVPPALPSMRTCSPCSAPASSPRAGAAPHRGRRRPPAGRAGSHSAAGARRVARDGWPARARTPSARVREVER